MSDNEVGYKVLEDDFGYGHGPKIHFKTESEQLAKEFCLKLKEQTNGKLYIQHTIILNGIKYVGYM